VKGFQAQRGFTLLELIICLAIIFILALMILPEINNRGCRSPSVACMSNQKQIAIAALIYQNDRKELPNLDSAAGNDGPIALSLLTNYLSCRTNLFMCPFVVRQREQDRAWYQARFVPELNTAFFRSNGNDYAYFDGAPTNGYTNAFIADRLAWTNRSASSLWTWGHGTLKGRINAAFVDGHAESLKADKTVGGDYTPAWSARQDPVVR
jgi:prepilin-type N-terminal cleavage/methylation domain-containing protein/prepilin-type processing-associated H-X9-DG protein